MSLKLIIAGYCNHLYKIAIFITFFGTFSIPEICSWKAKPLLKCGDCKEKRAGKLGGFFFINNSPVHFYEL